MKVGLFIPCYINAVYPEVGIASYKLLKHVGVDVDYPIDQTCCGQPMANAGFEDEAARLALRMEEQFKNYDYVVGPSASCVAFVKENHPHILGKRDHVCMNSKVSRCSSRSGWTNVAVSAVCSPSRSLRSLLAWDKTR